MSPLPRGTRGFPTQPTIPVEAWGGGPLDVKVTPRQVEEEPPEEVASVLRNVQAYIYTRRIRIKDCFLDFDRLRSGRCTSMQFARGLSSIVPKLRPHEMKILMEFYRADKGEKKQKVGKPEAVCYLRFIRDVDSVFGTSELEKQPKLKVHRPGWNIQPLLHEHPKTTDDEETLQQVLYRLALFAKTRGIVFRTGFQASERSMDTSLLCPRYAGKVTEMQFLQHFPFMEAVNDYELGLLLQRYTMDSGDVNYVAMDKELAAIDLDPPSPSPDMMSSRQQMSPSPRLFQSSRVESGPAAMSVMGLRDPGSLRVPSPQEQTELDSDLLGRIKAEVSARRLRVHGCFQEMDRLRRGVCAMGKARTVFTILRLELDNKELDSLSRIFNKAGFFDYSEFCNIVNEVPLSARNGELPPTAQPSTSPSQKSVDRVRMQHQLLPDAEDALLYAEYWIAKQVEVRKINVRQAFQDFDKIRSGRVTRSQFLRVMDMLNLGLKPHQLDVLIEAYSDASGREFSYLDLCTSLNRRGNEEPGSMMSQWSTRAETPRYFRRGKIVPLGAEAPLTARPCTR